MVEFAERPRRVWCSSPGSPAHARSRRQPARLRRRAAVSATERILAAGLRADYVEREGDLPALRGRLLPDRRCSSGSGSTTGSSAATTSTSTTSPTTSCSRSRSHAAAAIATLPRVRRARAALAALLGGGLRPGRARLALGPEAFTYSRHNEHYRTAHALSWLVLQTGPDDALATGQRSTSVVPHRHEHALRAVPRAGASVALQRAASRSSAQRSDSIFWRPICHALRARSPRHPPQRAGPARTRGCRSTRSTSDTTVATRDVDDLTQAFLYAYAYRDPAAAAPPRALLCPSERVPWGATRAHAAPGSFGRRARRGRRT